MKLREELNGYLRLPREFFAIPEADAIPDVGILGVPYDMTSSYMPGCRFGPDAIRNATDGERSHSYPLNIAGSSPGLPSLAKSITIEDIGDLEVIGQLPENAKIDISEAAAKLSKHGTYLFFLGGDHFITYPLLKGTKRGRPGRYGLIYFDSHADYYEDYGGHSLSHATALRRLVDEKIVSIDDIVAFDLRSALPEQREALWASKPTGALTSDDFLKRLSEVESEVDMLYVSVDVDILDPSVFAASSHPESGGQMLLGLASLLRKCFELGKVQFADIVEYNPLTDKTGAGAIAVRDIVKEVLTGFAIGKGLK
ncbi:MAG: arginase family protein [Promethearchaeota archaeon]